MKFSEITRITGKWGHERRSGHVGEYFCQVFDENYNYITCIFGNTYKEVHDKQKELKKGA